MSGDVDLRGGIGPDFRRGPLRSLREADVGGMLDWMHDPNVTAQFRVDFASVDEERALEFIRASWRGGDSLHLAVMGDEEGYLGTISLKEVDVERRCAEYAIAMRGCAHGTGAAMAATRELLALAFGELGLHRVYLNVRASNARAMRFYEKLGFKREGVERDALVLGGGASKASCGTRFWKESSGSPSRLPGGEVG